MIMYNYSADDIMMNLDLFAHNTVLFTGINHTRKAYNWYTAAFSLRIRFYPGFHISSKP